LKFRVDFIDEQRKKMHEEDERILSGNSSDKTNKLLRIHKSDDFDERNIMKKYRGKYENEMKKLRSKFKRHKGVIDANNLADCVNCLCCPVCGRVLTRTSSVSMSLLHTLYFMFSTRFFD
jgi:hypothetical protein